MAHAEPDPRRKKLKDYRHSKGSYCCYFGPGVRAWANNRRERMLRREWRDHKWDIEAREDLDVKRFNHKHSALWDIT